MTHHDRDGIADAPVAQPRVHDLADRYRAVFDQLPAIVYVEGAGPHASPVDVSGSVDVTLGISRQEWLEFASERSTSSSIRDRVIHHEDADHVRTVCERADAAGDTVRLEYRAIHRDGREVWIREDRVPVLDGEGHTAYRLGMMLDVTELMDSQRALHEAQTKFSALVEQIPAIVYIDIADDLMTTTYVSPQIDTLLGYSPQEYIDDPGLWESMLHPDDRDATIETYLRGRESGEPFVFEYRLVGRDGAEVWFRDSAIVLPDSEGRPRFIQGVMLDITERKAAEEQVAYLAYHDKLTSLPNRVMFDELLELSMARAKRNDLGVAVISIDLDEFKLVNDSLGHDAGRRADPAARRAAERGDPRYRPGRPSRRRRVPAAARGPRSDAPAARRADGVTLAAEAVAVRVQHALKDPFVVSGIELYVSASQGISVFPKDAVDAGGPDEARRHRHVHEQEDRDPAATSCTRARMPTR